MLEQILDMPVGTVGFQGVGEVDDDFERTVEPVLREEIAAGHRLRLLYVLGPAMREYDGDALAGDLEFAARHPRSYERVAVVSDEDWLRPALRVLSMLVPGQLRAFPVAQLATAKTWLSATDDASTVDPR